MTMPWVLWDMKGVSERQREAVQENVDKNPRCSPVTLTALPAFLSRPPQATLPLCAEDSNSAMPAPGHLPFWHWEWVAQVFKWSGITVQWYTEKGNLSCTFGLHRCVSIRMLAYSLSCVTLSLNWSWFLLLKVRLILRSQTTRDH